MKKLFAFLFLILFLSCEIMDDPPHPVICYNIILKTNSGSGDILSNEILYDIVYEKNSIDKWKCDEGIHIEKDTINHINTINIIICILPDTKTGSY
jgi:hypothetical protein